MFPQVGVNSSLSVGPEATNGSTATASAAVFMPPSIIPGDLLLLFHRSASGTASHTLSGWTNIFDDTSDASDDRTTLWWRQATGTEGVSVTITQTSSKFASLCWLLRHALAPPQRSLVAVGNSTTPDPSSLSPTGGNKDYLWLWMGGLEGIMSFSAATPLNYINRVTAGSGSAAAASSNVRLLTAQRNWHDVSEDPPSWLQTGSGPWTAIVVAIHPSNVLIDLRVAPYIAASR